MSSRGKRAIGVRAIEVLLYYSIVYTISVRAQRNLDVQTSSIVLASDILSSHDDY